MKDTVISIVSHGHGVLVQRLLESLARIRCPYVKRVVLTQNLPESEPASPTEGWPFELELVRNRIPVGFGVNHNRALASAQEPVICVLNPDVLFAEEDSLSVLVEATQLASVAIAYPLQLDDHGYVQDSARLIPSPRSLLFRHVFNQRETRVEWVNAACMVMPTHAWRLLQGFDERYFMYCEDVDLCLRARLKGMTLHQTTARVIHVGQRASRRNLQHLVWHLRSLTRLWTSRVYREARKLPAESGVAAGAEVRGA